MLSISCGNFHKLTAFCSSLLDIVSSISMETNSQCLPSFEKCCFFRWCFHHFLRLVCYLPFNFRCWIESKFVPLSFNTATKYAPEIFHVNCLSASKRARKKKEADNFLDSNGSRHYANTCTAENHLKWRKHTIRSGKIAKAWKLSNVFTCTKI